MRWMKPLPCLQTIRAKIARNTQIILQQESGICDVVDPMGGSNLVESLTQQMIEEAMRYIDEVEQEGGMTKAIEAGIPKMRIEEAAAKKQRKLTAEKNSLLESIHSNLH